MSKLLLPALIFSLALWLLLGSFWLAKQNTKNASVYDEIEEKVFVIQDGSFKAEASTIFAFSPSEAEVIINEEQLALFDSLALYLNRSREKQLLLIALYDSTEKKPNGFDNLGAARANSIKNILVRKGAPEDQVSTKGKEIESLELNENGLISGGIEFNIFDRENSSYFEELAFDKKTYIHFEEDQFAIKDPSKLDKYIAGLKQYLADHRESKIKITAFYHENILDNDLTIAMGNKKNKSNAKKRADIIRNFLLEKGINSKRMKMLTVEIEKSDVGEQKEQNSKVEILIFN